MKTKIASLFVVGFLLTATPLHTAFAIGNGDISIAPTAASDPLDPRTQSWFIYNFPPGTTHEDKVSVENDSGEVKTVRLYAVDGYTTQQGGFALRNAHDLKEHVGAWIILAKAEISLQPGQKEIIPFKYSVPQNVEPGEYAGGIIAEDTQPIQGQGIAVVKRVGVRIYHTVPGERNEKITLVSFEMKHDGGYRWFEATADNQGNVSVPVRLKEGIFDNNKTLVDSLQSEEQIILPHSRVILRTNTWKEPFVGSFTASGGLYKGDILLAATQNQIFFVVSPLFIGTLTAAILLIIIVIILFTSKKKKHKKRK